MLPPSAPLLLDPNPIEAPIAWILGSIRAYVQTLDVQGAISNPLSLLVPLKNPNTAVAQSPLARVVPGCGGAGSCDFERIASSIRAVGYVLFAILLVARMLKQAASGRLRSPEHLLLDIGPKLALGILAIEFFDQALNDLSQVSMGGAFLLQDAMLFPIHLTVKHILTAFPTRGLGLVLMPMLYLLIAYLLILVVTSRLVLLLGALISPLGIPIALYDDQGRLAGTWIRMIVSGLLVPVVAGLGAAGSLALAWLVHQVAGNGPYIGSYLGALSGECGLFFTAFATTAMFKDAIKQGVSGVRGSFEGAQMGPVARAPGEALAVAQTAALAGLAAAAPGSAGAASAVVKGAGPESDAGGEGPAPAAPRLPGGPGGAGAGSRPALPPPRDDAGPRLLLPGQVESDAGSPVVVRAAPSDPDLALTEEVIARRHVGGGRVIHELERRQVVHYATFLSEPAGDLLVDPPLGRAQEA